ncbi:MAG: integrase core domain-containing protein [Nitrospira sp.]|nr:integrase core domain-containing protein [Nitrospira sp.]
MQKRLPVHLFLRVFQTFEEARHVIRDWMHWYNQERPHQALGYQSPARYRAQQSTQVA